MRTFADVLRSRADDDTVGLCFGDREWTWAEVVAECACRAAALQADLPVSGGRQRHVGVLLDNVPDYLFWLGAVALSGDVLVGINPSRRGAELARDIRHTDCDLIVTESRQRVLLDGIEHGVETVRDIDAPGYADHLAAHRGAAPDPAGRPGPAPGDTLLLLFSSGSTGAPKAVVVSQGRLGTLADTMAERVGLSRESVTYLCMPLFHGNAVMMNAAPATAVGARIAMRRKFSASEFSADVHRYGVTYVNYVGRALSYVLSTPPDPRDADSTLAVAFGTEASEADVARFRRRFGCVVSEGFGLSEGVFRINRTPDTPPGALGVPVGGADVRVLDEATGTECPRAELDADGRLANPDAIGQLVALGGAAAFEGYYNNPGATAERVRGADFWSGDLAYRDADGFFYFAGRSSDWLRVDSENFAAAPVERILAHHPAVAAAAVYPVPDPRTGDQVMCALELVPGCTFDPDGFARFLDSRPDLGTKWWPRFVRLVSALPLTGNNKVDKRPLRTRAWHTTDPVYRRTDLTGDYRPFTPSDREALEQEFAAHGRTAHLPTP
ncbi:AMP-binding protein [Saccharomonospora iraqiensis]|uniref:AMP-binding protein n=1 Tax=Saccharomonospora iraqiensis TaxID=52698 RepID=UPI0004262AB9|nr:AMP-binding protein [Saccharomonospora iraqiensis]